MYIFNPPFGSCVFNRRSLSREVHPVNFTLRISQQKSRGFVLQLRPRTLTWQWEKKNKNMNEDASPIAKNWKNYFLLAILVDPGGFLWNPSQPHPNTQNQVTIGFIVGLKLRSKELTRGIGPWKMTCQIHIERNTVNNYIDQKIYKINRE